MAKSNKLLIMVLLITAVLFSNYVLATNSIVQSGTCGTCLWEIDDTGLLRIYPTDGESGILDSNTKNNATFWPWSNYGASIKKWLLKIVFMQMGILLIYLEI